MLYTRCPSCGKTQLPVSEADLWPGSHGPEPGRAEYPGDPSEPQCCLACAQWWQIRAIGTGYATEKVRQIVRATMTPPHLHEGHLAGHEPTRDASAVEAGQWQALQAAEQRAKRALSQVESQRDAIQELSLAGHDAAGPAKLLASFDDMLGMQLERLQEELARWIEGARRH